MTHLWQLIESNGGKPVARGQTADYAILPMNIAPDKELRAKQLVSNLPFFKENYILEIPAGRVAMSKHWYSCVPREN